MRRDRVEDRLERMSRRLNLTDEQKAKIRPILQDEQKQMKALREDASLSPDQRRQQGREIRTSARKQIDEILTPEQKEKRKEMWQKARKGRGPRGEQPPQQ
jgi:Spy/CpxP family protein refolding chaperone